MAGDVVTEIRDLKEYFKKPSSAENPENIWSSTVRVLEIVISQLESGISAINLTNQPPELSVIDNLTQILDEIRNGFLRELCRWAHKRSEAYWKTLAEGVDSAERALNSKALGALTEYMQWRRQNPTGNEVKQNIAPKRFFAAKETLPFTDTLRIAVDCAKQKKSKG